MSSEKDEISYMVTAVTAMEILFYGAAGCFFFVATLTLFLPFFAVRLMKWYYNVLVWFHGPLPEL